MVRRNILVNLLGRGIGVALSVFLIPIYLHILGVEAVGLIGFYGTLLTIFGVLEYSVGTVIMREMAKFTETPEGVQSRRDLLRTTEIFYLVTALAIGIGVAVAAPGIARTWLSPAALSSSSITQCVMLMGWTVTLQLGFALHLSVLNGLERQVKSNLLSVFLASARGVAALFVLLVISATSEAYFGAQLLVLVVGLILSFVVAWRAVPASSSSPAIRPSLFMMIWWQTPALTGSAILFVLLLQADKLMVSATLPLEVLGYYVIASTIASLAFSIYGSIAIAVIPRFARLLAEQADDRVRSLFHTASQFTSFVLLPVAVVSICHAEAIILLWTGDPIVSARSAGLMALLSGGALLIGLTCVSNSLQLAAGLPRFGLYANLLSLAAVPLAYFSTIRYGASGATIVWILMGMVQLIVPPTLLHRRLLKAERMRWYLLDLGLPAAAALTVGIFTQAFLTMPQSRVDIGLQLALVWTSATIAVLAACPGLWPASFQLLGQLRDHVRRGLAALVGKGGKAGR